MGTKHRAASLSGGTLCGENARILGGVALAYYQWLRCIPFETILAAVPMEQIERSYYPLHEADIRKFVEIMDEWMREKAVHPQTKNHTHTLQAAYTR